MPFQPFGYSFEVKSPSQPPGVKSAIRARLKGWFEPKSGARGWVVGPFLCLWLSAFDRYGPMLFGVISQDDLGTKVRGRAGSDLNGLIMFSLMIPILLLLMFKLIAEGPASLTTILYFGVVLLVAGPLIFWSAHQDRREAEPLVRFIQDAISVDGRMLRSRAKAGTIARKLTLDIGGDSFEGPVTAEAIHDALLDIGAGDFVILASAEENYIQAAFQDGGYILEVRNGDKDRHFQGVRGSSDGTKPGSSNAVFTFEEVREVFLAYASEAPLPALFNWERMNFAA